MNYFAHGRSFVNQPYFLAGTAVPDWLNVVDRRVRARAKNARLLIADENSLAAAVAQGIVQHHTDDDWFHQSPAFSQLSWQFTVELRDRLPGDDGFRPSFLGHILVEILLDAVLIEANPQELEAYYAAVCSIDPMVVEQTVGRIAARPADNLATMIEMFCKVRFLFDYLDDDKLFYRLGQVMRRVALPPLSAEVRAFLPEARQAVAARERDLLYPGQQAN